MPIPEIPEKSDIISIVETIKLHASEKELPKDMKEEVANLPSKHIIINKMSHIDLEILWKILRKLWKNISGDDLNAINFNNVHREETERFLDGNYWMLPSGIILNGFNHFSIAKKHKGLFCSLLKINPFIFERLICEDPKKMIAHIIANGGIRINVDRKNSTIMAQTSEESFPWIRNKMLKMYHMNKIIKVIDLKCQYMGWESGINILIKT